MTNEIYIMKSTLSVIKKKSKVKWFRCPRTIAIHRHSWQQTGPKTEKEDGRKKGENKAHFNVLSRKHGGECLDPDIYFHICQGYCSARIPLNILVEQNDEPDGERIYGLLHLFLVKILVVNQDRRLLRATYITPSGFAKDYQRHHKSYSVWCPIDWANNGGPPTSLCYERPDWTVRIQGRARLVS